jgi:apolipoprotein N-acyltransferase
MFVTAPSSVSGSRQRWLPPVADGWAVLAGFVATTAMPPFPGTGLLMVLSLAVLFGVLVDAPHPARTAWFFGLAHQLTLLHWLFLLIPAATISSRGLVPVAAISTILYVSLFYLVFGGVFQILRSQLGGRTALALAPVLWTAMEAARGAGELGFPWCLSGAAWIKTPVLSWTAASGEIGLGAATAFTAAAIVAVLGWLTGRWVDPVPARGWWLGLAIATGVLWSGIGLGAAWRLSGPAVAAGIPDSTATAAAPGALAATPRRTPVRIAAVQADVALADKWERARIDSTRIPYTELTGAAARDGAKLVVWAETAVPSYLRYEPALLDWVSGLAAEYRVYIYTGFPDAELTPDGQRLRFNSSGLFNPRGRLVDFYAKHHLLPVGERMPFSWLFPAIAHIDVGQAEWAPGEKPVPIMVSLPGGDFRFAGLICFESIFSDLSRQAVRNGAQVLINITNDGWFGKTAGPRQHAELARLRAAACGVPLVRCANNGVSFITDARGSLVVEAGLGRRAFVAADVLPQDGRTAFVRYGSWPLVGFLALWSALALLLTRRVRGP